MTNTYHIRSYTELSEIMTFEGRLEYLRLSGCVGADTFGFDRQFNQIFYRSAEWKRARDIVIARDMGCDLGAEDRPIFGRILIHHINPITMSDIREGSERLLDPENLICASHETHNMIHYGTAGNKDIIPPERSPGDMILWRRTGTGG